MGIITWWKCYNYNDSGRKKAGINENRWGVIFLGVQEDLKEGDIWRQTSGKSTWRVQVYLRTCVPCRRKSECKGPEEAICLRWISRTQNGASVVRRKARGRVMRGGVREGWGTRWPPCCSGDFKTQEVPISFGVPCTSFICLQGVLSIKMDP